MTVEDFFARPLADETDRIAEAFRADGSPFEVTGRLGRGRMAIVLEARQRASGRDVALKVLRSAAARDTTLVERFLREVEVLRRLVHPAIVALVDHGVWQSHVYAALELVRGPTLARRFERREPFPWAEACRAARDIARGLAAAHASGVCHRDLKPSNVFLLPDGSAKVADFGLARIEGARRITAPRSMLGTPLYSPPEQLRGEPVDHRSDLYSLGVMLCEALLGVNPFMAPDLLKVVDLHFHLPPPGADRFPPTAPAPLVRLVTRLLAKSAADRPGSAADVADELEALLRPSPGGGRARVSAGARPR